MSGKLVSIVLPLYNEEENIFGIIEAIKENIPSKYDYEIILIDDGSFDSTRELALQQAQLDKKIKFIGFYRNFGHQAAVLAGIKYAGGDAVITIDADFQHPPELIPEFISGWEKGHDLVVGQKKSDSSSPMFLKLASALGYRVYKIFSNGKLIPRSTDFRLINKHIHSYIKECGETRFLLRGLTMIPAKNICIIPYDVPKRRAGKTGYDLKKRVSLFILNITSFSTGLLRYASGMGMFLIFASFLYLGYIIYAKFVLKSINVEGWTALMFVMILLFGFLFIYIGILSEYISTIFDETKKRPQYLIEKTVNLDEL